MPENTGSTWKTERFEIVGYGRRFGTTPFGQRAAGYHLGNIAYSTDSSAVDLNCSGAWSSDSQSAGSWTAV